MSPALAKALAELFVGRHEITHIRLKFGRGDVPDREWITTLAREGRWVVLSADRRITRNQLERQAFRSSNLLGFFLSAGLAKAPVTKQAERILVLWDAIEAIEGNVQGSGFFELPMTTTRVRPL